MHLYDDTSQQNQLAVQTQHIKHKKPVTNSVENTSNKINNPQQQASSKKSEILSKDTLLKEFESLENDDIPTFVAKIAKSSKEEQYNLLEIYKELFKKHDELMENDPSTKFKKEIREKYTEQLKKEIREEFDKSGKDYESTDVIKETYKRLDKMAQDAGLADYEQNTLKLGQKLATLRKQMEEQNISFVSKAPESFETEENKWKYIYSALTEMERNEKSLFDAFDVFEKYGSKVYLNPDSSFHTLDDLSSSTTCALDKILEKGWVNSFSHNEKSLEITNRALNRFAKVFSNFATTKINNPSAPDIRIIWQVFDRYEYCMNKNTMLTMIKQIQNYVVDKKEYKKLKSLLNHYDPKLYECIKPEDMPELENAVNQLAQKVKNLPDDYLKT